MKKTGKSLASKAREHKKSGKEDDGIESFLNEKTAEEKEK